MLSQKTQIQLVLLVLCALGWVAFTCETSSHQVSMGYTAFNISGASNAIVPYGLIIDSNQNTYVHMAVANVGYVVKMNSTYDAVWAKSTGSAQLKINSLGLNQNEDGLYVLQYISPGVNMMMLNTSDGGQLLAAEFPINSTPYIGNLVMSPDSDVFAFIAVESTTTVKLIKGSADLSSFNVLTIGATSSYLQGNNLMLSDNQVLWVYYRQGVNKIMLDLMDFSTSQVLHRLSADCPSGETCTGYAPKMTKNDGDDVIIVMSTSVRVTIVVMDYTDGTIKSKALLNPGNAGSWFSTAYSGGIAYFVCKDFTATQSAVVSVDVDHNEVRMKGYPSSLKVGGVNKNTHTFSVLKEQSAGQFSVIEVGHWDFEDDFFFNPITPTFAWSETTDSNYDFTLDSTPISLTASTISANGTGQSVTSSSVARDSIFYHYTVNVVETADTFYEVTTDSGTITVDYACIDSYPNDPAVTYETGGGLDYEDGFSSTSFDTDTRVLTYSGLTENMTYATQIKLNYTTGGWSGVLVTPVRISFVPPGSTGGGGSSGETSTEPTTDSKDDSCFGVSNGGCAGIVLAIIAVLSIVILIIIVLLWVWGGFSKWWGSGRKPMDIPMPEVMKETNL